MSYKNIAEQVRGAEQFLRQAGMFAPMIMAAAGQEADPEVIEPIKEVLALLPSVAEVVSKFDYKLGKLSVTQSESDGNSYRRHSVVVIRPASAAK